MRRLIEIKTLLIRYLVLFSISFFLSQCEKSESENDTEIKDADTSLFADIEKTFNLKIHYEYSDDFFPESWLESPISGYGIQIDSIELERMELIIEDFLSKYSQAFISENLFDIYILKHMYFYNKSYGGTSNYKRKAIYVTNDGYSYNYILGRLHSEFSSILFHNFSTSFPSKGWISINPSDFEYVGNGVSVLGQDNLYEQTTELLSMGFLVKYSTSSLENDFNMFIDWMFTRSDELIVLIDTYENIYKKHLLVKDFYYDIGTGVTF